MDKKQLYGFTFYFNEDGTPHDRQSGFTSSLLDAAEAFITTINLASGKNSDRLTAPFGGSSFLELLVFGYNFLGTPTYKRAVALVLLGNSPADVLSIFQNTGMDVAEEESVDFLNE
jgi:hypothetical protein